MTMHLQKTVSYEGRSYILLSIHERFEMFVAREVGRQFVTYVPFDAVQA